MEANSQLIKKNKHFMDHLEGTHKYLSNDLNSHRRILMLPNQAGGLGFGMCLTAFATFDLVAYLKYGGRLDRGTGSRYKDLLNEHYFDFGQPKVTYEEFYFLLRCGLVHQLYPKNIAIGVDLNATTLLRPHSSGIKIVEAFFLMQQTIIGLRNFISELKTLTYDQLRIHTGYLRHLIVSDLKEYRSNTSPVLSLNSTISTATNADISVTSSLSLTPDPSVTPTITATSTPSDRTSSP